MKISTIQKKQIVGITGLAMVGFVLAHLSGNFLIFKGPEAFNAYAKFLHDLGGLLWVMRIGILGSFLCQFISCRKRPLNRMPTDTRQL